MVNDYVPDRGDIVFIQFNPQLGREQAGRRPALILSPASYNKKVGLALICPITNKEKGYPFESKLPEDLEVQGVVLSDHVKSLDWKARNATFKCFATDSVIDDVLTKLQAILSKQN